MDDIHYIIGSVGVQFECEEFMQYNWRNVGKNAGALVFIIVGTCRSSLLSFCAFNGIWKWEISVRVRIKNEGLDV